MDRRGQRLGSSLRLPVAAREKASPPSGKLEASGRRASWRTALEGGGFAMRSRTTLGLCVVTTALSAMVWSASVLGQTPDKAGGGKIDAEQLYKDNCLACHQDGNSQIMPNMSFADGVWVHGSSVKEVANTIANGSTTNPAMMPFKDRLTPPQIEALAKYVRQFDKKLAAAAPKGGRKPKA
jgi:cytochrome c6